MQDLNCGFLCDEDSDHENVHVAAASAGITKTKSRDYERAEGSSYKPYVFFDLREIGTFTRNNYCYRCRTLGSYNAEKCTLLQYNHKFVEKPVEIPLIMETKTFPEEGDVIEVFGYVNNFTADDIPILLVAIYNRRFGDAEGYIKIMKKLRKNVPEQFFDTFKFENVPRSDYRDSLCSADLLKAKSMCTNW